MRRIRQWIMSSLENRYQKQLHDRGIARLAIVACEEMTERGESVGDTYCIALDVFTNAHAKATSLLWLINLLNSWLPGRKSLSELEG